MHIFHRMVCVPLKILTPLSLRVSGLHYSLIGPFEALRLNANGMIIVIVHESARQRARHLVGL